MNVAQDDWHPVDAHDRYNGKIYGLDGRAAWVVPVRHDRSGWAVEVRDGNPDGPVVERSWHPHRQAAGEAVDTLRSRLAMSTIDDVVTGAVPSPPPSGVVAVHGIGYERSAAWFGSAGSGPAGRVCLAIWVPPGETTVRWLIQSGMVDESLRLSVQLALRVEEGTVVHVGVLRRTAFRPKLYGDGPPRLHRRCRACSDS